MDTSHTSADRQRRGRQASRGFTLVELLVVIGIIGMLVALLLPAVMSGQEQARQTQCAKQMKDLAGANLTHAIKKGTFPGWDQGGDTWVERILPYLDMQQAFRTKSYQTSPEADPLFYCPSNPPEASNFLALGYAANAGSPDGGSGESDGAVTAIFHNRTLTSPPSVGLEDIRDGKRNTALLAEIPSHGDWDQNPTETTVGFNFDISAAGSLTDGGVVDLNNVQNTNGAPASFHQEGFNVAYCDGHTEFYYYPDQNAVPSAERSENEYRIFRAKMTPAGEFNDSDYDKLD